MLGEGRLRRETVKGFPPFQAARPELEASAAPGRRAPLSCNSVLPPAMPSPRCLHRATIRVSCRASQRGTRAQRRRTRVDLRKHLLPLLRGNTFYRSSASQLHLLCAWRRSFLSCVRAQLHPLCAYRRYVHDKGAFTSSYTSPRTRRDRCGLIEHRQSQRFQERT